MSVAAPSEDYGNDNNPDESGEGKTPSEMAIVPGKGGIVPPINKRFQPGHKPPGRPPNAGRSVREKINDFASQNLTEDELRRIARSKTRNWTDRSAAERMLKMLEYTDLAEFDPLLTGEKTLTELRSEGINTEVVKRCKRRVRTVPRGAGQDPEEIVENEVELHSEAREEAALVLNTTDGNPIARIANADESNIDATPHLDESKLTIEQRKMYIAMLKIMEGEKAEDVKQITAG